MHLTLGSFGAGSFAAGVRRCSVGLRPGQTSWRGRVLLGAYLRHEPHLDLSAERFSHTAECPQVGRAATLQPGYDGLLHTGPFCQLPLR